MTFGLRVSFTEKDKAALSTLAARAPHLVGAAWEERAGDGFVGIFSEALDADLAADFKVRGLDIVRHRAGPGPAPRELVPVVDAARSVRSARSLVEIVRPIAVGDAVPAEAIFFAPVMGGSAQRTLERLLLLERSDAQVCEVDTSAGHMLVVRLATPPLYLLYRAREELSEAIRVYTRVPGTTQLYCAWGTTHLLAAVLDAQLKAAGRVGLVDADGSLMLAPATWDMRPILDAVRPDLSAQRSELQPMAGSLSFPVRLRMGPADVADPELWILTPEELFKLEGFVENSPAEEVGRILVSRVSGTDGRALYVVREAVRPAVTRLGARVSSIVGSQGFARATALDNLYLPPGRRLVPQLAREQLKTLLGLDAAAAVVVREDADGLAVVSVKALEDLPLTRFTTWTATDRRLELDRLAEDAVASFPGVTIEKPARVELAAGEDAPPRPPPKSPKARAESISVQSGAVRETPSADPAAQDLAVMRAHARDLEQRALSAGAADPQVWRSLGAVKLELREADDAATCHEVALFLGASASAKDLATAVRSRIVDAGGNDMPLEELALIAPAALSQETATLLGARVVNAIASGGPLDEDIVQIVQKTFLREGLPVGRRMQWAVLHAISGRARDALGATRAKEAVLGALNARGLSEALDLPRFVRSALALMPADEGGTVDRGRHEQLVQLEALFARAVKEPLKLTDSHHAFLRAIFAVGLGRLGGKAPEIVRSLQSELDVHDPPVRVLLRLYMARLSHFVTKGAPDAWASEVSAAVAALARPEEKRVVEWLVKRSQWLRTTPPDETPKGLRPALDRLVATAERNADELAAAMGRVDEMPGLYDFEVKASLDRLLGAALASGRDEVIHATLLAALRGVGRMRIAVHRIGAFGTCVRAAATLEDAALVDQCLDGIIGATRGPSPPSLRDLVVPVKTALAALRRLGAVDAAQRFLAALEPLVAATEKTDTGTLQAALADGYLQLGDADKAKALVNQAFARALKPMTSHVDRYESGVAVLEALAHWDLDARSSQCAAVLAELPSFTDTFTTMRYYYTHQLLIAERLVETIVDDVTLRSDRLQSYLDGEEQIIRRRILQQWSALCGR